MYKVYETVGFRRNQYSRQITMLLSAFMRYIINTKTEIELVELTTAIVEEIFITGKKMASV